MPSRDIAVVYDAVMCGPEKVCDRQGGVQTACRAHDGIFALIKSWVKVAGNA